MPRPVRDFPWLSWRNGIAYVNWYEPSTRRTKRESLDTKDNGVARLRFAEWLSAGGPERSRAPGGVGITVAAALEHYDKEHVEKKVVDPGRQRDAMAHLRAFFADTPVRDVTVVLTRAYAEARRSGHVGGGSRRPDKRGSDSTIRRELNVLVAAANHCVKMDHMPATDAPRVELPTEHRGDEVKWLTKDQLRAVFDAAGGDLRAFIRIAYYTAARRRSIERLRKAQVDLKNSRIDLGAGLARTKKRRPIVPLYPEIRPDVERLLMESETDWLFGAPRDFYRDFVALAARLGIEAHPHMLRHSRATHMLMDGEDPYKVAKLLGDTLQTVQRVYGHHCPDYLATESRVEERA